MSVTIHLPTALRAFAEKQDKVDVHAATAGEALKGLTDKYDRLGKHLLDENGKLRNFVNVYLNDEDIRDLKGPDTPVKDGDELLIVPAIAGGATTAAFAEEQLVKLSKSELNRYNRHLILPEVGMKGQIKLKNSRVLLIGTGGLGAPLGLYLAAAGVGKIGLVDDDVVDASNLQRQILYSDAQVGVPKIKAAKERLSGLNPDIDITTYETRLSAANALDIIKDYDMVIDGTDNFPTRYLVNDACVLLGKPNVYGSIFRFEGQVSVFWAQKGPCYRCLYPSPPPPGLVPSCAEGGVLGVLPGIIGTLQANEAIKLLVGIGTPLIGRLTLFNALDMKWRELKLKKNPDCPICGKNPTITELIDYEEFCGIRGAEQEKKMTQPGVPEITVEELKKKLDAKEDILVLDVREPHELEICRLEGTKEIPLGDLETRFAELDKEKELIVHCRSGGRSAKAVAFLKSKGYDKAVNLAGGILAWAEKIDPSMQSY